MFKCVKMGRHKQVGQRKSSRPHESEAQADADPPLHSSAFRALTSAVLHGLLFAAARIELDGDRTLLPEH